MQGLHLTMPQIFMRMNHVESSTCQPPRSACKNQLVDPPRTSHCPTNLMVMHSRKYGTRRLRKHMNLMVSPELFRQRHRIPFGTSTLGIKVLS